MSTLESRGLIDEDRHGKDIFYTGKHCTSCTANCVAALMLVACSFMSDNLLLQTS